MTREKKIHYLEDYCKEHNCSECPVYNSSRLHEAFYEMTERKLDRCLELIAEDLNKETIGVDEPYKNPIKPDYYNDTKISPIDVIEDWCLDFCLGSALKYIKRAGKKENNPSIQDLKKVIWYIERRIKELEEVVDNE